MNRNKFFEIAIELMKI